MQEQQIIARRRRRKLLDKVFQGLFLVAIGIAVATLIILLYDILSDGLKYLRWEFITGLPSRFYQKAGILPALVGSFYVIGLTALFTLPVGVATAVYLQFYAEDNWLTRTLQTNISNLAGVPSIVYGLFGLAFFVRFLAFDRSIMSASLTLSLLILPIVIVNTQEAIKAVPISLEHAGYALGASRWQVIRTVILPTAMPGILTGVILALSRALGETAPLITVGAWAFTFHLPTSVWDSFTVLPVQIWVWSAQPKDGFRDIAASAIIVLLAVLLTINTVAILLRNKYQKKAEW